MNQSNSSKQVLLSVIGVAILVVAVVGVSFAFFNYTRTGTAANSVQTGKINFTSSQDGAIAVTNFFPQRPGSQDTANTSSVDIQITGSTTYENGLVYRITALGVENWSDKVPVQVDVSVKDGNLNSGNNTFTPASGTGVGGGVGTGIVISNYTQTTGTGIILGNGTIGSSTPVTGNAALDNIASGHVTVTAYIPANVAITDTYTGDTAPTGYTNGTTDAWVNQRTRVTTAEWNALGTNPVSFKIRVEAKEAGGTYMDEVH